MRHGLRCPRFAASRNLMASDRFDQSPVPATTILTAPRLSVRSEASEFLGKGRSEQVVNLECTSEGHPRRFSTHMPRSCLLTTDRGAQVEPNGGCRF